jgi:hypothetical protein
LPAWGSAWNRLTGSSDQNGRASSASPIVAASARRACGGRSPTSVALRPSIRAIAVTRAVEIG